MDITWTDDSCDEVLLHPKKSNDEDIILDSLGDVDIYQMDRKEMEIEGGGQEEREQWTNGLDFILTLVGYAVGVSNLWRFPYLCLRNGGGAFLIPFFFFLFLCGIPLFYLEVCLGQFSGISSMFVWKMCPMFKGIGYGMVLVSGFACIYYNTVLSWVIYYLINSFRSDLPWASCDNWWNTATCITSSATLNHTKSDQSPSLIRSWSMDSLFNLSSNDTTLRFSSVKENSTAMNDWIVWIKSLASSNQTVIDNILDVNMSLMTANTSSYYFTSCHNSSSLCLLEGADKEADPLTAAQEFWE